MRFKRYLTEKWIHSANIKSLKKTLFTEIFYNPTKSEYRDVAKASKTGSIPAMRGRLATGFINARGDVWMWRGDIWHYDLPQDALDKIGKGKDDFHFGFSENEVSLYSVPGRQITKPLAQLLVDRLAQIEPKLKKAKYILVDDMYLEDLLESRNIPGGMGQGEDVWEVLLMPQDTPPETDSRGNYILYHGTILSTAKEIIKTKLVKQSSGWGTGVTTTPWEAKGYAGMKRVDVGGLETGEKAAVLQMVIDKDWLHKMVIQREVGGHGKNEFLIRGDIVPKAIKKIKIWRTFP